MISSSPENKYKFPHTKKEEAETVPRLFNWSSSASSSQPSAPFPPLCVCVSRYAYLCLHVFMYGHMYEHMCIWKPKVDIGILPQWVFILFFETGSLNRTQSSSTSQSHQLASISFPRLEDHSKATAGHLAYPASVWVVESEFRSTKPNPLL